MPSNEILEQEVSSYEKIDRVLSMPEVGPILKPFLSILALPRVDYTRRYNTLQKQGKEGFSDELSQGLIARLTDEDFEQSTSNIERGIVVDAIVCIADSLHQYPHYYEGYEVDWLNLSMHFLQRNDETLGQPNNSNRSTHLFSALLCTILPNDRNLRTKFIETIYDMNLQNDMADILDDINYWRIIIESDDSIRIAGPPSLLDAAFKASKKDVAYYIARTSTEARSLATHVKPRPKKRQYEIYTGYQNGNVSDEDLVNATFESRPTDDQESFGSDIYKIERFALQQMFIKDQLLAVFPEGRIADSAFAKHLAQARKDTGTNESPFYALRTDVQQVMSDLTRPVIDLYHPGFTKDFNESELSRRQQAALRFKKIGDRGIKFYDIAKYIDFDKKIPRPNIATGREIWNLAEHGAAAPIFTEAFLSHIVFQGICFEKITGEKVMPEELYALAHQHRKSIMRLAMSVIEDFSSFAFTSEFRPIALDKLKQPAINENTALGIQRDEEGTLRLDIPFISDDVKGLAKMQAGTTLGCPAGRVALAGINHPQDRGLHSANNFIDYIVEATIDEAYQRGLFDLTYFKKI